MLEREIHPARCSKCGAKTQNVSGFCKPCRARTCKDCGKRFDPIRSLTNRCGVCKYKKDSKKLEASSENDFGGDGNKRAVARIWDDRDGE